jgi:hypothetical protein
MSETIISGRTCAKAQLFSQIASNKHEKTDSGFDRLSKAIGFSAPCEIATLRFMTVGVITSPDLVSVG